MRDRNGVRGFAAGFLAGAAVGAIGALMMATAWGKRFRKELSREGLSRFLSEEISGKEAEVSAAELVSHAARNVLTAARAMAG